MSDPKDSFDPDVQREINAFAVNMAARCHARAGISSFVIVAMGLEVAHVRGIGCECDGCRANLVRTIEGLLEQIKVCPANPMVLH